MILLPEVQFEVLIIGGGPAGLTCALSLARLRRRVLVCDDGQARNAAAIHMQNFPSREGTPPLEFRKMIRAELAQYSTVEVRDEKVISIDRIEGGFKAQLAQGQTIQFRKLVIASGVKDELPDLPGMKELWGKSVAHCPFCHGYENRDQALAFLASDGLGFHILPLLKGLSKDLILFTDGKMILSAEERELLKRNQIPVFDGHVVALQRKGFKLTGIELEDGRVIPRDFLFFRPPMSPRSDLGEKLGCQMNDMGMYVVDDFCRSTEKDIFVAGDLNDPRHSVLLAASFGTKAAGMVVHDLLNEEFLITS